MIDAKSQKIAVAGKGGTGKTTLAGTLARILADRGERVWAIDADSTPNLALTLGLPRDEAGEIAALPRTLLEARYDDEGNRSLHLPMPPADIVAEHGHEVPGGVRLLLMGKIDHAGAG